MINGFTLFKYDRVVKLHFTNEKYNLFENKGNAKGMTFEKFLAKRDYNIYNALARKFETDQQAIQFLVSNYAYRNTNPIHNIASSDRNFTLWTKRKQSITNTFREDIDKIQLHLDKNDVSLESLYESDSNVPDLFKIYLSGNITIETMFILNKINPYLSGWKQEHSMLWGKEFLLIEKLERFVKYDSDLVTKIYKTLLLTNDMV